MEQALKNCIMTEDIFKDLCLCGETTKVQFKESFTSQKEIAKEMIAFANTKGGVILFGVEDKCGKLVGLSYDEIQVISRELGNAANEQVRPTIYIETEVVRVEEKHFLICSVEEGKNKPYKNLNGEIWVKQGADKRPHYRKLGDSCPVSRFRQLSARCCRCKRYDI